MNRGGINNLKVVNENSVHKLILKKVLIPSFLTSNGLEAAAWKILSLSKTDKSFSTLRRDKAILI